MLSLLSNVFSKNYTSLLATYGLTFLENIFELLYPLLIGHGINDLLEQKYIGIVSLAGVWFVHTGVEVLRNIYDTMTFTRIYNNLVVSIVLNQHQQGVSPSQIAARSALSREFVDFFERDVPKLTTSLFSLIGSLALLLFYDLQIVSYCLFILIPITLLQRVFIKKSLAINHQLNDQLEREVETLTSGNQDLVNRHYKKLASQRIKLSNMTALNWGVTEVLIIAMFILILLRTRLLNLHTGDIYAVIAYAWNYRVSLDVLPAIVQQLSRLKDIAERMTINK
ncbi:MAG: ABC transporter six-transmembrane domain-containing protein [Pseudanabaenaceae cyanobacterium bins.68]|nr:ABC transporter six-transmembrane domain-containing protein [Pseudanabaenaceae cyanobacterium bins.68]